MQMRRVLPGIEPFNDLFYRTCFYSSLIPVLKHFNINISHFIDNDVIYYKKWDRTQPTSSFLVNYHSRYPVKEWLTQNGVMMQTKEVSKEIISDIISALDSEHPVVCFVDCYYLSLRLDRFQKMHWQHSLLIFGYDLNSQMFDVIEHDNFESLTYKKRLIPFDDIEKGYYGYLKHFEENQPTYYEFSKKEEMTNIIQYSLNWPKNIREYHEEIKIGLQSLQEFILHMKEITSKEELLKWHSEELLVVLNNIILAKQSEKYKMGFFGISSSVLEDIISNWMLVRAIIAKFVYSLKFKSHELVIVSNKIEELYTLEFEYYERLLNSLK